MIDSLSFRSSYIDCYYNAVGLSAAFVRGRCHSAAVSYLTCAPPKLSHLHVLHTYIYISPTLIRRFAIALLGTLLSSSNYLIYRPANRECAIVYVRAVLYCTSIAGSFATMMHRSKGNSPDGSSKPTTTTTNTTSPTTTNTPPTINIQKADSVDHGDGGTGGTSRSFHEHDEPDERTSLLSSSHHGVSGQPPLDIDDPAVTPLNLWSIRFLRYFTLLLLAVACVSWLILLVITFVNPPGMHSRGGGWYAFGCSTLAVGVLGLLLFSFTIPSRGGQVVQGIIAVLLLVNFIVVLSVPELRGEEGWIGIASSVFVLFVTIWAVIVDRTVEWGKKEEEERLTGRAETRRSLKEWFSVFTALVVIFVFLAIAILFTGTLSLRAYDHSLKVPGRRVWVDDHTYQVHVYCTSRHNTNDTREGVTVFLEAGERAVGGGMLDWAHEAYVDGKIGRLCYWDRPGYGFSDVAPSPLSAGMVADALSEALAKLGESGPFILVSAGVGSIYSRIFAARHGRAVKGLLLIDPVHEEYLPTLASPSRGFFLWFRGVTSPLGLETLLPAIFRSRTREDRIIGRSSASNPRLISAKLQESLAANTFTKAEISTARETLERKVPLVVVSSGESVKRDERWDRWQQDMTKITDHLIAWDIVSKAPHRVWETQAGVDALTKRVAQLVDLAVGGKKG
ncbi:hypothetical protein TWF696_006173 [Orbilia brochopaga]|uniref:Mitochondrial integral membrane protein n=1 Tax=Orbilia brochopaga TaxID=3140254 RepID=A0AAV9UW15_9PEZI